MKHISVPVDATIELLNFTPVNPLISKCQIKVCYVGDKPNRNGSQITKEVATEMAKSLPGCPIVGFYNEKTEDFEEHNRMIDVSNGRFEVIDTTRPYGFVDLNAKVWFQKFADDNIEHEYLMTEGYIWSKVYPESQRILTKGNNQSMELDPDFTEGSWALDDNGAPKFFIINEAIIQKLCILGEDVEPCFEGAGIATHFSLDDDFKTTLHSMVEELHAALQEGGKTEMENNENEFALDENQEELNNQPEENSEDKGNSEDQNNSENFKNEEENSPIEEPVVEEQTYSLEDIPEYVKLAQDFAAISREKASMEAELATLREFKAKVDRKEKQDMIDSFYMLSDKDKEDVIKNIDTYSLGDIEAKLCILCVRNKVNFNLDDSEEEKPNNPMVYSLEDKDIGDDAPAWLRAVRANEAKRNMI